MLDPEPDRLRRLSMAKAPPRPVKLGDAGKSRVVWVTPSAFSMRTSTSIFVPSRPSMWILCFSSPHRRAGCASVRGRHRRRKSPPALRDCGRRSITIATGHVVRFAWATGIPDGEMTGIRDGKVTGSGIAGGEYAVVSINTDSARAWQPSARIQRSVRSKANDSS